MAVQVYMSISLIEALAIIKLLVTLSSTEQSDENGILVIVNLSSLNLIPFLVHWSEGGGLPVAEQLIVMLSFSGTKYSNSLKLIISGGTV